MRKRILAGLAMWLLMVGWAPSVHAASASFSIISANRYGNSYGFGLPQSSGYRFTVLSNIVVSSLGFFDYLGDGLGESHTVGIFNSAGELLTSAVVFSGTGNPLDDGFRYTNISPLTLSEGENKKIRGQVSF